MEEEEDNMSPPFWTENGRSGRRLSRSYSLFLGSGALVMCIIVIALAFTLIIVPTLHSFAINIFKPNSVKKSWDSLNLMLILFAIICAFLSKNTNEENFSDTSLQEYDDNKSNPTTPPLWYEETDRMLYKPYNRLRSFNSYPDLRQDSPWIAADQRWRFYDDTRVNGYRGFDLKEEGVKKMDVVANEKEVPSPVTAVSPPLAPSEKTSAENKNKRTSATKELLTSLKGKKKKHKHGSVENSEATSHIPHHSSVFHNLIPSKKSDKKKLNSVSSSRVSSMFVSKTESVQGSVATLNSGVSKKKEDSYEENVVVSGNESPLTPIPPPPPPPPFNMPAWKFRVQGDFVRIDSISSSSSDSSDTEDEVVEAPSSEDEILLVYTNPDVDAKAGNFIERFRAGLMVEEKQWTGTSNLRPSPKPKAGPS